METKVKDRGWVKNVAIVFLAVLLVLTFFSNTILNRSLPEVATRSIAGGSITARIRVTGTVAANQSYQVMFDQSRRVRTVNVRVGQTVSAGDVLFVLADGESTELESARETLSQLQRSYQERIISNGGSDYARENRQIQQAQEALDEAIRTRDENTYDEADLLLAEQEVEAAQQAVKAAEQGVTAATRQEEEAQTAFDRANAELSALSADSDTIARLQKNVESARAAITEAQSSYEAARLIHGTRYDWIRGRAEISIKNTKEYKELPDDTETREAYIEEKRPAYMEYVVYQIEQGVLFPYSTNTGYLGDGSYGLIPLPEEIAKYTGAYNALNAAQETLDNAYSAYEEAVQAYDTAVANSAEYARMTQTVKDAKKALEAAQDATTAARDAVTEAQQKKAAADEALETLRTKKSTYLEAEATIKSAQRNLDELVFSLEEQQKSDNKTNQINALELQAMREQIAKQKQLIEELESDSGEQEIKAEVGGTIETLNITAGQTTTPGTALATIELPDLGYTLTASVANDQARRVHVGDTATVSNYYWGSQINATLTTIRTDPRDPQNSKQLIFEVSGDVTPGSNLTLNVGERSADYDYVVPNSAIRSDSNGDFILVVVAKNSPLGDRYTATRVDVTRLSSDDTSTAVSGALDWGDFVITTSTAPIKNGDRVRLADSQN